MLRIQRSENGEVVFALSGQMDEEPIAELETLINSEANGRRIVLDLKDLTLVNEDAITFLERCESNSITLKNCPAYVREWINAQRRSPASTRHGTGRGADRRHGVDQRGNRNWQGTNRRGHSQVQRPIERSAC